MELTLNREILLPDGGWAGRLFINNDQPQCYTLEPNSHIPAGRYRVVVTVSGRSAQGYLWSPRDNLLPLLLNVPGRSGIRIHAGVKEVNSTGCILVGRERGADDSVLLDSRIALEALMNKLLASNEEHWITVA